MSGIAERFVNGHFPEVKKVAESYLAGDLSHREVQECSWRVLDDWEKVDSSVEKEPYIKGEKIFWALVMSLMTSADERHWAEGVPQKEITSLLQALETTGNLPEGWDFWRPGYKKP